MKRKHLSHQIGADLICSMKRYCCYICPSNESCRVYLLAFSPSGLSCLSSGFGSCRALFCLSRHGQFLSANARRHVYITKIKRCMGQHATFLLAGGIRLQEARASVHSRSQHPVIAVRPILEYLGVDEDNVMTEEIIGWLGTRRYPDPNQCSC